MIVWSKNIFTRTIILLLFILFVGKLSAEDEKINVDLQSLLHDLEGVQDNNDKIDLNLKIALNYYYLGQLKESLFYSRRAQNALENDTDPLIVAKVHLYLGNFLLEQAKYTNALDHFQISYNIYSEKGHLLGQSKSLANMGIVFERLDHPEIALEYGRRVLDLNDQMKDSVELAITYTNMGNIYLELEKYELAYSYYRDAADLDSLKGNQFNLSVDLNNLGILFQKINEPDIALYYFQKSYELEKEMENILSMAGSLENIAKINEQKNNLEIAYRDALLSLEYAKQSGSLLQEKNTSALLSSIEEKRGNSKEAFNWYKNYISISDIIVEEQKSVTQVETKHLINTSIDKSRTKIKVQNQVKNILLAVVLILVFGITIGLLGKLIRAL